MTTRHILILDDGTTMASLLREKLEHSKWNCAVSATHSPKDALEMLNLFSVDLLVADLCMPGLDGPELIGRARASSPQTRTVFITAYGDAEVQTETRLLEICRIITEPLDILDFTWVMQEALRDVAISRHGLTVLSDDAFQAVARQLEYLRRDVGARGILLADMSGHRLVEVGGITGLDTTTLLSLLSEDFATIDALARQVGDGETAHLNLHKGTRYEIYTTNVDNNLFLVTVYDLRVQASRIGIVWLHSQRAVKRLLTVFSAARGSTTGQSLDTNFGSSLTAELDTLLAEDPLSRNPSSESEPPHTGQISHAVSGSSTADQG